nr:thioredoxin-like protein 1 [Columba livia]
MCQGYRCGPCLRIAPAFNALSNKYPQATFLEVDVHQCQGTAATNNISATPTFLFFRNKVRIDQYQGADAVGLEEKIKQHLENDPGNNEDTDIPKGYMDLMPFINKAGCECLNESDEHGFDNCLRKDATYLESDCDEQLLITVAFSQPVKLYSMKLQGPDNGQGPKYVKIFINLPRSMDFEEAERSEPTQALELTADDIKEDGIIQLRYVKFQNVNSVTLFVQSNHGDEETTRITYFTFIGTPVQATNMNDFKRVVGKKGESH